MRRILVLMSLMLVSCGGRQAEGSEGQAAEDAPELEPEWSECEMKGEVETCTQVCERQGLECVADMCPANPDYCDPEPCDMATQLLGLNESLLCAQDNTEPDEGAFVASACDTPIDWLSSNLVRCCCADVN